MNVHVSELCKSRTSDNSQHTHTDTHALNQPFSLLTLLVGGCHGYLTRGKGLDGPEELRNILDGHLQAEGVRSERQHLGLLQELTPSGPLCCHHSLQDTSRKGDQEGRVTSNRGLNTKNIKTLSEES